LSRNVRTASAAASGRQYGGGLCIAKCRIETFSMARQFRREQRHRNGPRLDRCEESGDVIDSLRREDRYPVDVPLRIRHGVGVALRDAHTVDFGADHGKRRT
jgi:hypothetical protein